ncbi:MAG: CvpA family protein [Clostridiales bacterium]|jgi:uncharacterized membrane protein required for colicin V production|nr:CvpA family protein [Clostridiales bacterium]
MFNTCDVIIALILLSCLLIGYKRGLVRSLYSIGRLALSLYVDYKIYPVVSRALRGSPLYGWLKGHIVTAMRLEDLTREMTAKGQAALLNQIPQSAYILRHLQANNNPEAYEALDASGLADYIGGYFANMAVNLIAFLLVLLLASALIKIAFQLLDRVVSIPPLNFLNKTGGTIFGMVQGVFFVWAGLCILTFFFLQPQNEAIFLQIQTGRLARIFYENNPLMKALVSVIPG